MDDLTFRVLGARVERHAAVPTLVFELLVEERSGEFIDGVALRSQLRIEPQRRRYGEAEAARLVELFGETPRWGDTLKPFLWVQTATMVPAFRGSTRVDLPVACTYDFEVAAAKYLHALEGGEIPVLLLFSGTVFARREERLSVRQIPWDREAPFRLPVRLWREMMDQYFPDGGWLRLRSETLNDLLRCKARRALPSWDAVLRTLLVEAGEVPP